MKTKGKLDKNPKNGTLKFKAGCIDIILALTV